MIFYVEITDTFGGEANYSWITRHKVSAKSELGAIQKISRDSGISWRRDFANRYNSKSGATCLFIDEWDDGQHSRYSVNVL